MKNLSIFFSALVALLFSVAETSAQITPPYYNPANVNITGGAINGTTVGETTPANATASRLRIGASNDLYLTRYAAKQVMISGDGVGTSSGNTGVIIGSFTGATTQSAMWHSGVTPSTNNFIFYASTVDSGFNGVTTSGLYVGGSSKFLSNSTLNNSVVPLSVTDTTDSSSTTTGSLKTAGGLGVAKKSYFGDSLYPGGNRGIITWGNGSINSGAVFSIYGQATQWLALGAEGTDGVALVKSTGLTVADGKTFQVGSGSTTSAGLIAGYYGVSGYGALWSTGVTPSTTNYSFTSNAASTALNASTNINLSIANSPIVTVTGTQAKAFGGSLVRTNPTNYVSGTGTAGVDNTAQAVVTIALAAGTLSQVGDRIRVRVYWTGDTGTAITGTLKINGVTIADTTDSGAASLQVSEAWLHYIDNTHANIIENENGALGNNSAVNVAGFSWNTSQNIVISQNAIANNHIVVYFLAADIFPK